VGRYEKNKYGFRGYQFKINDVVWIGRLAFWVRSISTENYTSDDIISETNEAAIELGTKRKLKQKGSLNKKKKSNDSLEEILDSQPVHIAKEKGATCRICLGEEEDEPDSCLISPCKCSGTMKYIHLCCLKNWLD
jgi:hypothetical protein